MDAALLGQPSYLDPIVVQNRGFISHSLLFFALFKSYPRVYLTR